MKNYLIVLFLVFFGYNINAQENLGFILNNDVKKEIIPFELASNLIIVPVQVNGVLLNFIVDTGSTRTVVFDFKGIDTLNIKKEKIVRYSGKKNNVDFVEAYFSDNNIITIGRGLIDSSAEIVVMKQSNSYFVERLGMNVNGILGTDFFKKYIIKIDYVSQNIYVFNRKFKLPRDVRKAKFEPIKLIKGKPYINGEIANNNSVLITDVLIDTGSSDSLWLHEIDSLNFSYPRSGFNDYLGYTLTGEIYGRRSKLDQLSISGFKMERPTVSFPDYKKSLGMRANKNVTNNSNGSIGGEILRRFDVIFDFENQLISLSPNSNFNDGFYYNMAGIQLKVEGMSLVVTREKGFWAKSFYRNDGKENQSVSNTTKLIYEFSPNVIVSEVRSNSLAEIAGIRKGDLILKVNSTKSRNMTLQSINKKFYTNPYSNLKLTVKRGESTLKFKFKLIPLIE
ncbi:MAG: aspartyl protease family protein [Nonlabens ulvanivorans]